MTAETKRWAVVDCGLYSNDKCCQMKLMAPEEQFDDVLAIAREHVIQFHGLEDTPELPAVVRKLVVVKEM